MFRLFLPLFLLTTPALGQNFLVTKFQPARLSLHDGTTGALLNDTFIDVDALLGLGGAGAGMYDAIVPGNGEIWVTNYTLQAVHRFTDDGLTYLGDFPTSPGGVQGIAIASNSIWLGVFIGSLGAGVFQYHDTTFALIGSAPLTGVYDTFAYQNEVLVSLNSGSIERVDPTTGTVVGTFGTPGGLLEQIAVASNGNLLVSSFYLPGVLELDPSGNLVQSYIAPSIIFARGVAELGNGELLMSGVAGVFRVDPNTGASIPVDGGGAGGFVVPATGIGAGGIGQGYCGPAVVNSTGMPGIISATGSTTAADDLVTLRVDQLPLNHFGYFLNSQTQAFTFPVPSSQGALCLGGAIGRYNAQVLSTGNTGSFVLQLDLASTPTPAGTTAIVAGQRWNFTAWYRDTNPTPTSNFTDGLNITFQ